MNIIKGMRLGNYVIEGKIAEGAMGAIYRASQPGSNEIFAVKVMQPELSADADFRKRFIREVTVLQSLEHPHIIPVTDAGEENEQLYFVMPFIKGSSLAKVLNEQQFSPATAWLIIEPIAHALTYIHEHHIIHRDLKPANILVRSTMDAHPYLADFGLSKALDKSTMTEMGIAVGTAAYMSPEQVKGTPITYHADIYALGIIVYEMLLGAVPFGDGTTEMIALQQVREAPPPPRQLNPKFPAAVEVVILQALAKDPAERFDSANEFGNAYFEAVKSLTPGERMASYRV